MDIDTGVMWPVCEDKDVSDVAWLPARAGDEGSRMGMGREWSGMSASWARAWTRVSCDL